MKRLWFFNEIEKDWEACWDGYSPTQEEIEEIKKGFDGINAKWVLSENKPGTEKDGKMKKLWYWSNNEWIEWRIFFDPSKRSRESAFDFSKQYLSQTGLTFIDSVKKPVSPPQTI